MPVFNSVRDKAWPRVSHEFRSEKGNACEFCGAKKGEVIKLVDNQNQLFLFEIYLFSKVKIIKKKIIIDASHINHNKNSINKDELQALCRSCHASYDANHRNMLIKYGYNQISLPLCYN